MFSLQAYDWFYVFEIVAITSFPNAEKVILNGENNKLAITWTSLFQFSLKTIIFKYLNTHLLTVQL